MCLAQMSVCHQEFLFSSYINERLNKSRQAITFRLLGDKTLMGRASRHKPQKLAEKLQKIREQSGLSMSELIDRIGSDEIPLYKADISKYEAGTHEPPLFILLRYAKLGKVSVESLIDDELEINS